MSNIIAGIGRGQLLHLDEHIAAKKRIYRTYCDAFSDLPVSINPYLPDSEPNFWLTCMTIDNDCPISPKKVMEAMAEVNAEGRPIWKPMHMQPVFAHCDFLSLSDTPVTKDIFDRGLCLPSDIKMTEDDLSLVIGSVRRLFSV